MTTLKISKLNDGYLIEDENQRLRAFETFESLMMYMQAKFREGVYGQTVINYVQLK